MNKYRYGVIGSFVNGRNIYSGQAIKTRNFSNELKNVCGESSVLCVDTFGWKKHPLSLIRNIEKAIRTSEEIVILPADRGIIVIPRIVSALNFIKKRKLKYVVIGGWLPEFLKKRPGLTRLLKRYDGIFVEAELMKQKLENAGFDNISVMPNFKQIEIISKESLVYAGNEPYKLCTFSRISKEKGIEDAVIAVKKCNEKLKRTVYTLDIYGKVDANQEEWFEKLKATFPEYVSYKGMADSTESSRIVKEYFALLFPTYFEGEGYPGTLLDAFCAGVPVIASDWRYNSEIIGTDKGFLHKPNDPDSLAEILERLSENPDTLLGKKVTCLEYAETLKPETVIKKFCTE